MHCQRSCPLALLTQAPMSASDCSWLLQRLRMRIKVQMRCDMQRKCKGEEREDKKTLKKKKKKEERKKEEDQKRREREEFNVPPGRGPSCGEAHHHSGDGGHCVCIPVGAGCCWRGQPLQRSAALRGAGAGSARSEWHTL